MLKSLELSKRVATTNGLNTHYPKAMAVIKDRNMAKARLVSTSQLSWSTLLTEIAGSVRQQFWDQHQRWQTQGQTRSQIQET